MVENLFACDKEMLGVGVGIVWFEMKIYRTKLNCLLNSKKLNRTKLFAF